MTQKSKEQLCNHLDLKKKIRLYSWWLSGLDKNKSGSIDFKEFFDIITSRKSDKDTQEKISKVFRFFDDYISGSITLRYLLTVANELRETMTDEEL